MYQDTLASSITYIQQSWLSEVHTLEIRNVYGYLEQNYMNYMICI